jgi:hypothetical protein
MILCVACTSCSLRGRDIRALHGCLMRALHYHQVGHSQAGRMSHSCIWMIPYAGLWGYEYDGLNGYTNRQLPPGAIKLIVFCSNDEPEPVTYSLGLTVEAIAVSGAGTTGEVDAFFSGDY